jgi:uncharacterized protein YdeI (YjbR/CyaY-like superfamily)
MRPRFFRSAPELRRWLEDHHADAGELLIGFPKKGSGKTGISYPEALDEALCFGWIDGVRKGLDESSYTIRFSPRRPNSIWSAVNIARARELVDLGRMRPPGLAAFERRREDLSRRYSYEQGGPELGADREKALRANRKAWAFFRAQPPSYRRMVTWWVISAKREETRQRRLDSLIEHSAKGERVPPL